MPTDRTGRADGATNATGSRQHAEFTSRPAQLLSKLLERFLRRVSRLLMVLNVTARDGKADPVHEYDSDTSIPGQLSVLKTKAECCAANDIIKAYMIKIPQKSANSILSTFKEKIPGFSTISLSHLRRFVKPKDLTEELKSKFGDEDPNDSGSDEDNRLKFGEDETVQTGYNPRLCVLICPASLAPPSDLLPIIRTMPPFTDPSYPAPRIFEVPVPLFAPTSPESAEAWTRSHWPTIYRRTNPFGPNPSSLSRAEEEIGPDAGQWLALAYQAGKTCAADKVGEPFGCVIVERRDGHPTAIAVAGDARWGCSNGNGNGTSTAPGNVMAHATMRAISMVAKKRRMSEEVTNARKPNYIPPRESPFFEEHARNALERHYFDASTIPAGGYLCHDMEIYLSHEPCVMCCMAILHSRLGRCVFSRRMPLTGGLTADAVPTKKTSGDLEASVQDMSLSDKVQQQSLGYGLFWRPELNWKFMAWEWKQYQVEKKILGGDVLEELHA